MAVINPNVPAYTGSMSSEESPFIQLQKDRDAKKAVEKAKVLKQNENADAYKKDIQDSLDERTVYSGTKDFIH